VSANVLEAGGEKPRRVAAADAEELSMGDLPDVVDHHTECRTARALAAPRSRTPAAGTWSLKSAYGRAAPGGRAAPRKGEDVLWLMTMSLSAIADYGGHYGFDARSTGEREFLVVMLGVSAAPTGAATAAALGELQKASALLAGEITTKQLAASTFHKNLTKLLQKIGVQTTRSKVAQLMPFLGIAVGGGVNVHYMRETCIARRKSLTVSASLSGSMALKLFSAN
jgi:hypothetical protein